MKVSVNLTRWFSIPSAGQQVSHHLMCAVDLHDAIMRLLELYPNITLCGTPGTFEDYCNWKGFDQPVRELIRQVGIAPDKLPYGHTAVIQHVPAVIY